MRNAVIAIVALSAATAATITASTPAAAHDYPYCVQGRGVGIPGDCSYSTYGNAWRRHQVAGFPATSTRGSRSASSSAGSGSTGIIDRNDLPCAKARDGA